MFPIHAQLSYFLASALAVQSDKQESTEGQTQGVVSCNVSEGSPEASPGPGREDDKGKVQNGSSPGQLGKGEGNKGVLQSEAITGQAVEVEGGMQKAATPAAVCSHSLAVPKAAPATAPLAVSAKSPEPVGLPCYY